MAVNYIDNVAWRQVRPIEWGVNGWGVDTGKTLWRGAQVLRDEFLATIHKWAPMPGFAFMFIDNWGEGPGTISFPGIELSFVGFRSGSPPDVHSVDDVSVQTAQGSGTDTATDEEVSGSFVFKASRTVHTWYETATPPEVARYNTVNNPQDPFDPANIIHSSIQAKTTGRNHNIPYSSFVTVFNSLVRTTVVSTYVKEPVVPNKIWVCRSEVDYKLL